MYSEKPNALYDVLYIISQLQSALNGVSASEVHRVAFLSCILFAYEGHPASDWGYSFAGTEQGTPFARYIDDAIIGLTSAQSIEAHEGRYRTTARGDSTLSVLARLETCVERNPYLEASTTSVLSLPAGALGQALANEPTTASNELRARGSLLLEGAALELLHQHFTALREVLGSQVTALIAPSMVWLSYMSQEPVSERLSDA